MPRARSVTFSMVLAVFAVILAPRMYASDHAHGTVEVSASSHAPVEAHAEKPGVIATLWNAFLTKLEQMQRLDEHNVLLRQRNAELELENARLQSQHLTCAEVERAEKLKRAALYEGGVETARTIASLRPRDEKILAGPPKAIYEEALKSFKEGDFETAGRALTGLVNNQENNAYKDAPTYYLTAVSLYKVGNYKTARAYFEEALKQATGEHLSYAPRALGWIALCHSKLGDEKAEKRTVRELIEKFPKSKEARRLNRRA